MGKQIKLPNIDFVEVGNTLVKEGKNVGTFVSNHVPEVLTTILVGVTIDNIRVRMGPVDKNEIWGKKQCFRPTFLACIGTKG